MVECSLCGKDIRGDECRHPWRKPFADWNTEAKKELWAAIAHFGQSEK